MSMIPPSPCFYGGLGDFTHVTSSHPRGPCRLGALEPREPSTPRHHPSVLMGGEVMDALDYLALAIIIFSGLIAASLGALSALA